VGYSGAEITFIAKEAAMAALRRTIDIKSILKEGNTETDFSHIDVNQSDFFNALLSLKWNSKYANKTYSLKG
jgi:SpoVK/Ycf46/Vps4 family AAA+-type ATPase